METPKIALILLVLAVMEVVVVLPLVAPRVSPQSKPIVVVAILGQSFLMAALGIAAKLGYIFNG